MTQWRIPAGREPVIQRLLAFDPPDDAWTLVDWAARPHWIDARYRTRRGELVIVRLYPRERSVPVEHRTTDRFTLALIQGRPATILDRLAEQLAAHEHAFEWERVLPAPAPAKPSAPPPISDPRELDCERMAFELGLKPAIRQLLDPADAPWAATMYVRGGAAVCGVLTGLGHGQAVLMAAPTLAAARAMLDAEFMQFEPDPARALAGARSLGLALGYPACCVEAFLASVIRDRGQATPTLGDANWQRIDAAWVALPNPRINSLLFGELLALISFDPCRFDCPAAAAIADALLDRLAESAPLAVAALDAQLARPVFIDEHDRRAWLELDVDASGQARVRAIEVIRLGWSPPPPSDFAPLIGQRLDERGHMPELAGLRHRVFRFDRASG